MEIDDLPCEADKKIFSMLEAIAASGRQGVKKTNRESLREEVGEISEEFMDVLLKAVSMSFVEHGKGFAQEGDSPEEAMAFAVFESFREGVRLGKQLGIEEGLALPRIGD